MKHPALRALLTEWDRLRANRAAPDRAALSPAHIPNALADTFVLTFDAAAGHPVRLAGSRVCALFGAELHGRPILDLFDAESRADAVALFADVADRQVPVVAGLVADSREHGPLDLEMLVLPLRVGGATHERLLGGLAAPTMPWWLATDPLRAVRLVSYRHLDRVITEIAGRSRLQLLADQPG